MQLDRLIDEAGLARSGLAPALLLPAGVEAAEVTSVSMDSRSVQAGTLFACVPGGAFDGHTFAATALEAGATALLCERELAVRAPQLLVGSVRRALGPVSDAVYGHPSAALVVAGVTGTNGKTTTCAFLDSVFEASGWRSSTIGTLTSARTTPEAPELNALLARWRAEGGQAVAMEVSSHALAQHRTDGVRFAVAVFTNLTPEHLDFHPTMDAYFEAKARLFDATSVELAVINTADPWGGRLAARLRAGGFGSERVVTYSPDDATDIEMRPGGSSFTWDGMRLHVGVGGGFNVANAVAAAAAARALGVEPAAVAEGLGRVAAVPGRFQLVEAGQAFTVIVDYAHTPDGLTKVLEAARQLTAGRLIAVFGAGGDRDRAKRPLMGQVGAGLADLAIITSDNPRSEDPDAIIAEIMAGATDRSNVRAATDRAEAIATAVGIAQPGDVVVIAGKGHEKGQEMGGRVVPFDDVAVAAAAITRIAASRAGGPGGAGS